MEIAVLPFKGNKPSRSHADDAGLDLISNEELTVAPRGSAIVSLGTAVKIPEGHFGFLTHRSSMAFKRDCVVSMGVVDAGYTGDIKAKVFNLGDREVHIEAGERICQLIVIPFTFVHSIKSKTLEDTERGVKGIGSTGR